MAFVDTRPDETLGDELTDELIEDELLDDELAAAWLLATELTHMPWLLTLGLCGFVAVQLLRATDETVEP